MHARLLNWDHWDDQLAGSRIRKPGRGRVHGWRKLVEDGELVASRKNGTIVVSDHTGRTLARFTFTDAWPSRVSIDTDPESGLANETIVLAVETLARE